MKQIIYILTTLLLTSLITGSCNKNKILSGSSYDVNCAIDTLLFDTDRKSVV